VTRRVLSAAAALVVIGAQAVMVATPAAAITVSPNVNVTMRGANQAEAAIAIDPTNPSHLVIASNSEHRSGVFLGVSQDGGLTWTRSIFAAGDQFGRACCDSTMSWDAYGNLFFSWIDLDDAGAISIAISTDGGLTFDLLRVLHPRKPERVRGASAVPVREGGSDEGDEGEENPLEKPGGEAGPQRAEARGSSVDQPTVVTGAGSVWLVWNNNGSMQAAGAPVAGLGQVGKFLPRQDIPKTGLCSFGDVSIGPAGQVMNVCTKDNRRADPLVTFIKLAVDPDGLGPEPFGPARKIGTTYVRQFDPIRPQRDRSVDAETGLAWDVLATSPRLGRVFLLYTDEDPNRSSNTDIWLRYSDDEGATWTPPTRVNDVRQRAQFLPRVAIDPTTGNLAVGWHDARNDAGDHGPGDTDGMKNTDSQYFLTFSIDGGVTFAPAVQVSAGTSNAFASHNGVEYGDYSGLVFHGGFAFPSWADNSNSTGDNPGGPLGTLDVHMARVSVV
jgi:hypothetical protein